MGFIEMTFRVLVLDDEPEIAEFWISKIGKTITDDYSLLPPLKREDIRDAVQELLHRRSTLRNGKRDIDRTCPFDDIEILIVDYDLLHIDENNAYYTGEGVGRLARMFSNCAVVVILNQFLGVDFDLSLRGHMQSYADLNINSEILATPGLWRSPPWEGFRPWVWQTLSKAVKTQRAREKMVEENWKNSIVNTLGMREEDAERLSATAFGFIARQAKDFDSLVEVTFRDFLSGTLNKRDVEASLDTGSAVRLAAARIGKWLEREVLGPQDVLIDTPHLVQRFPFLIGERMCELDAWNDVASNMDSLPDTINEEYAFRLGDVLSRPAVWGQRFEKDGEIVRKRSEFDFGNVPDFVFAEDMSAFVPMENAKEFRASYHNFFDRRFAAVVDGIRYMPQRRLAFRT